MNLYFINAIAPPSSIKMDSYTNPDPSQEIVQSSSRSRLKGVFDYFLIIRDRWLLSVALSLPIALGFVYKEYQQPNIYQSSSSFRLIPPPAILNLQRVERENQLGELVRMHNDGLKSQELKVRVLERIKDATSPYKSTMLAPYVYDEEQLPDIPSIVSYSVAASGAGRPVFTITATGRSSQSVQLIADLVQTRIRKVSQERSRSSGGNCSRSAGKSIGWKSISGILTFLKK